MKKEQLLILPLFVFGMSFLLAQTHLSPPNGGDGVPGRLSGSFAIEWEAVTGAATYEFVLTDNSQCFAGCAGDTRQEKTTATQAIQSGLREGVYYYWITRVFFENGDSTGWTPISNFLAVTAPVGESIRISSPSTDQIVLWVDWQSITDVLEVEMRLVDLQGKNGMQV